MMIFFFIFYLNQLCSDFIWATISCRVFLALWQIFLSSIRKNVIFSFLLFSSVFSLYLSGNAALPSAFQVGIISDKDDVRSLLQKIAAHYKESEEEKKVRDLLDFALLILFCSVLCLQTLNWYNQGLTSQQLEAKIAALSQSECEQVAK